jgi:hypothetical protein
MRPGLKYFFVNLTLILPLPPDLTCSFFSSVSAMTDTLSTIAHQETGEDAPGQFPQPSAATSR